VLFPDAGNPVSQMAHAFDAASVVIGHPPKRGRALVLLGEG
jgi:hypothetical protein